MRQRDKSSWLQMIFLATHSTMRHINYEELSSSDQDLSFHKLENALRMAIGLESFNKDVLRSLGLYKNGKYNIAAALLADKNTLKQSGVDIATWVIPIPFLWIGKP